MSTSTDRLTISPLDQPLGAAVDGIEPGRALSPITVSTLTDALTNHGVLVFGGLTLTGSDLVSLGRAFGELEILPEPEKRDPEHPEIFDLTNIRPDGEIVAFAEPQAVFLRGTERWHTDSSFRPVPCLCTMLYGIELPPTGGETCFADMTAAYTALPQERKEAIDDLRVVHSYEYSRANNPGKMEPMSDEERAKFPPVSHPLVRTVAGRRSLYLGGHASHIDGLPVDEGRRLLAELEAFATDARFVYEHRWQPGDLVVWDNRTTLHRLLPYDIANHRRVMKRITVAGTDPVI